MNKSSVQLPPDIRSKDVRNNDKLEYAENQIVQKMKNKDRITVKVGCKKSDKDVVAVAEKKFYEIPAELFGPLIEEDHDKFTEAVHTSDKNGGKIKENVAPTVPVFSTIIRV